MAKKDYDPLNCIPTPGFLRERLARTEREAEKLRILLDVAERLEQCERNGTQCEPTAVMQGA